MNSKSVGFRCLAVFVQLTLLVQPAAAFPIGPVVLPPIPPIILPPTSFPGLCEAAYDPSTVSPRIDCAGTTSDGRAFAVWGYKNTATSPAYVPVGGANRFLGGDADGLGQPVSFEPGTHAAVFATFQSGPLKWKLGTGSASSGGAATCPAPVKTSGGLLVTIATGETVVLEENPDAILAGTVVADSTPPPNDLPPPNNQGPFLTAGRTKGQFSVSDHGDATYDIPLWVPPGRAGVQPNLSLSYSSAGGNGPLGVGWSVSGFSQIARCATTIAANGVASPIHFDANDRMCLDGDYLVRVGDLVQTPYGSGPEYRPTHAPWTRVVMVGDDGPGLGASQFVVFDKSGQIHLYGARADSRFEGQRVGFGSNDEYDARHWEASDWVRHAWLLSDTQDRSGNGIRYTYTDPYAYCMDRPSVGPSLCKTFERVPSLIDYTYRAGDAYTTRMVRFNYAAPELRPDASIKFVSGLAIRGVALLTSIDMLSTGSLKDFMNIQRRYLLKYSRYLSPDDSVAFTSVSNRELLRSVQECDGAGVCKPRSVFEWELGDRDFDDIDTGIAVPDGGADSVTPDPNHQQLVVGDFNGDGLDDLVLSQQVVGHKTLDPVTVAPPPPCPSSCAGLCKLRSPSEGTSCESWDTCCINLPPVPRASYTTYPTLDLSALKWSLYTSAPDGTFAHASDNPSTGAAIFPRNKGLPAAQGFDIKGDGTLDESVPVVESKGYAGHWSGDPIEGCHELSCVDPEGAGRYVLDMDGDGRADLMRSFFSASFDGDFKWAFRRKDETAYTVLPWFVRRNTKDLRVYAADLDGTGRSGLVFAYRPTRESDAPRWYSWALLDSGGAVYKVPTSLTMGEADVGSGFAGIDYQFTDFNGDGLSDALAFWDGTAPIGGATVLFNTGHGFEIKDRPSWDALTLSRLGPPQSIRMLNLHQNDSPVTLLTQSKGTDTDMRLGRVEFTSFAPLDPIEMRFADIGAHPIVWRKDGSHFIPQAYGQTSEEKGVQRYVQTGDFNGDGLIDFTQLDPITKTIHIRKARGKRTDMMTHVWDGFDQHTWIDYGLIVGRSGTCAYPMHCVSRGLWVVSSFHRDRGERGAPPKYYGLPGVAGIDDYTVAYDSPRWDHVGRGFLGFAQRTIAGGGREWITAYDNVTNYARWYGSGSPGGTLYPYAGIPRSETVRIPSAGFVSVRATQYEIRKPFGDPVASELPYSLVPIAITETEDQGSVRVRDLRTRIAYDGFDNPTLTEVRDRADKIIRKTAVTDYLNDSTAWLLGRPRRTVTSSTEGAETFTRNVEHAYEAGTGLLVKTVREPGATDSTFLRIEYTRDGNGLVIETRRTPFSGGLGRVERMAYDDVGFPVTTTNMLGHVTKTTYHSGLGVLARLIDPNGVTTTYQYDGFGRMRQKIAADGANATATYVKGEIGPYAEIRAVAGAGASRVEYDRAGRSWRNDRLAVDGRVARIDTDFDAVFPARAAATTLPYFIGDPIYGATRFSYDAIGRLERTVLPDAKAVTKTYDFVGTQLRTTTTDEVGHQSFVVVDELGRVVKSGHHGVVSTDSSTPHDVATTFTYHPFDLPATVTDAKGNVVRSFYDVLGRRVGLSDPDAAVSGAHYNAFDEIDGTVDLDGVSTFVHDRLGRMTRSDNTTDGVSCFTYDTAKNGIGDLAHRKSVASGAETRFEYDALSRAVLTQDTIDSRTFRVRTDYDGFGRPKSVKYPEIGGTPGLVVAYAYADGTNGELQALSESGGGYYWNLEERDAAGRTTRDTLGNGVTTRRGYDSQRGWLSGITATSGTTTIQNIQYARYGDGNVRVRSEVSWLVAPPFASYDYDALGRLVTTTLSDGSSSEPLVTKYEYDDIGNLRKRTSPASVVEEYKVEGARPHATTSTDGRAYAYDAVGNQTVVNYGATVERRIEYTSFGLPLKVTQPTGNTTFLYDAAQNRVRKTEADGSATYYVGGLYELRLDSSGAATHVYYVSDVAQVTKRELAVGGPETKVLFRHSDHLQSSYFATDAAGAVVEGSQQRFDAYGRREEWGMPGSPGTPPTAGITMGFTGHEQDDDVGFINMRGRIYDPKLARFLTPDPHVTAPFDGRSYNRYAYALGNPTNVTDPSGFDPDTSGGGSEGGALGSAIATGVGFLAGCLLGHCSGGSGGGSGPSLPIVPAAPIVKAADTSVRTATADDNGLSNAQPKIGQFSYTPGPNGVNAWVYRGEIFGVPNWQLDFDETDRVRIPEVDPNQDHHLGDYQRWLEQAGWDAPGEFLMAAGSMKAGANNPGIVGGPPRVRDGYSRPSFRTPIRSTLTNAAPKDPEGNPICPGCRKGIAPGDAQIDHFPETNADMRARLRATPGATRADYINAYNWLPNLRLLCSTCNQSGIFELDPAGMRFWMGERAYEVTPPK